MPMPMPLPIPADPTSTRLPMLQRTALCSVITVLLLLTIPARAEPDNEARAGNSAAMPRVLQDTDLMPQPAPIAARVEAPPLVQALRDRASDLVLSAMNFIGVSYRRGGDSMVQGFDCSGFTRYVFEHSVGLMLPRRAEQQALGAGLLDIRRNELRPGDLVFFNTLRRAFSHVGIYVGEGKFIHSPRSGGEVRIEDMRQAYWAKRFNGARRAEATTPASAATF